jgi:tRNA threonylcarbamoyladenosine biosynthesis protein TsaB
VKVLALDTATQACSAAVLNGDDTFSRFELLERGHAERILSMIDEVLKEAALTLDALDGIGVGRGPGGFTGVRLAVSIAQGLAFGAGLRVAPISDLRAVAQRTLERDPRLTGVLVCNDARMNEVYWTYAPRHPRGFAEADTLERVGSIEQVELPVEASGPIAGVGSGFRVYPPLAGRFPGRLDYVDDSVLPHAEDIARLAALELQEGRAVQPERALPVYVRNDVARPPPSSRN